MDGKATVQTASIEHLNTVAANEAHGQSLDVLTAHTMKSYKTLQSIVGPLAQKEGAAWPIMRRAHRETEYNDLQWFEDYFGNAIQHINFAQMHGVAPAQREIDLRHALHALDARRHEFTFLESRLLMEHAEGRIDDNVATSAITSANALWQNTEILIQKLSQQVRGSQSR